MAKRFMCVFVENYDQVDSINPFAVGTLESKLAEAGALISSARHEFMGGTTIGLRVMREDLKIEEVIAIFNKCGFEVKDEHA